ncbi:MAG TPA: hypothetical protein VGU64_14780 [Terriglobales bacterium]|nr:hypothetical protein [Terriglobales bacterium]
MITLKSLILATALLAGATSLVLAPVAGGAAASPAVSGPASGTSTLITGQSTTECT